MSTESKVTDVINANGIKCLNVICNRNCLNLHIDLFVNVNLVDFVYTKSTNLTVESFCTCLIKSVNPHQDILELKEILRNNIFKWTPSWTFEVEECPFIISNKYHNFKIKNTFER